MSWDDIRILVLGGTGMLGHEASSVLADHFDVHATARDPDAARRLGVTVELHPFEVEDDDPDALLDRVAPDVLLNCVGIVKQAAAAALPIPSIEVNSLLPHRLAEACARRGVRLIHVSTDCVFSGRLPRPERYTERDVPDPVDLYGRSKLLGEVTDGDSLTLRTSIIGWELQRTSGLLEWLVSQKGQPVRGFANAWFSGLTTRALSEILVEIVGEHGDLAGLFHVSADPISKLHLVTLLNDALELHCRIEPVDEPRINRVLDSSLFRRRTEVAIPSWESMLAAYTRGGERAESR